MDSLTGQTIKGYDLRDSLGAGGFGAVYRAYQAVVDRDVAIKVILPQFANQPDFIRGFEAEARMVARLEHPHIVPLYDYWRDPAGAYIVMRYLRGGSLQDKLRAQGRLSVAEAGHIVEQLGPALMVAHRNDIIHRDLKPPNVMLDEDGNAYLSDFGISKDLAGDRTASDDGALVGSPAYLAPEQITGKEITPATDIYSFGILIYEMLTGLHPYANASTTMSELIARHLSIPMPHLREAAADLPESLNAMLQKATAKDPADRYPDTVSVVKAFHAATGNGAAAIPDQPRVATPPAAGSDTLIVITPGVKPAARQGVVIISDALITFRNPYKGLRAFEEGDASDFFGRETLIEHLLGRMGDDHPLGRFLAVVGASGSGKSSVVKAGLVPALREGKLPGSDQWFFAEITPGATPLIELENALLGVATRPPAGLADQLRADERGLVWAVDRILGDQTGDLLLVIDQFEELFTVTVNTDEREQFLDLLRVAATDPASRLRIVITLRADFMDRPLQYVDFGDVLRQRIEFVLPMTPAELEHAIAGPAERVGVTVEPDLLAAIMADLSDEPGALPLLQYALTELFEQREGPALTLAGYQKIGGVLGALAQRAEDIFNEQTPDLQAVLRQVCLRLVTLGEGTEDTRRRVRQSELAAVVPDKDALQTALEMFGKPRLLTFDRDPATREPTVEVAHEALIREWDRLRQWLDDSRDDIRLQRRLAAGAAEWCAGQEDPSYLLSGAQLAQFESWAAATDVALTGDEQDYLAASAAERDRLAALERERQEHELRLQKRAVQLFRVLAAVMAVALLIGLILTVWALGERTNAQDARDSAETAQVNAERRADESQSLALAIQAQQVNSSDHKLALALAFEANQIENPPALAWQTLQQLAVEPDFLRTFTGHTETVYTIAFSPDGKLFASGSYDDTIKLWDAQTGAVLRTLTGHTDDVLQVAFSPDGHTLVSGSADHTIKVWDVETGNLSKTLEEKRNTLPHVAVSPNGQTIAAGGAADGIIKLWDVATGDLINTLEKHTGKIWDVAFSPDGQTLAAGSTDGTIKLWDVETGTVQYTLTEHTSAVETVVFSPNGQFLIAGSWDKTISVWDVASGQLVRTITGHNRAIVGLAINPDGAMMASSAEDGSVKLWNIYTGELLATWNYATDKNIPSINTVESLAFSPDGNYLIGASTDTTIKLMVVNDLRLHLLDGATSPIFDVAISPDGHTIAASSDDGSLIQYFTLNVPRIDASPDHAQINLWDAQTGELRHSLTEPTLRIEFIAFSADGQLIAGRSDNGIISVWDVATGTLRHSFESFDNAPAADDELPIRLVFSPTRHLLATGTTGIIKLWDAETGDLRHTFTKTYSNNYPIVFSPNGQLVAASLDDDTIKLWDVQTGDLRHTFDQTGTISCLTFSPDGQTLAAGTSKGIVKVWDVATDTLLDTFAGHERSLSRIHFSSDGHLLLSIDPTEVKLWDMTTGTLRYTFASNGAFAADFSPDGQLVAVTNAAKINSEDINKSFVDLYEMQSGSRILSLPMNHPELVYDLAFSPDGQWLVIGAWDNSVEVWDLSWFYDPVAWTLEHRTMREFTCAERAQFYIEPYCEPGQDDLTPTPSATPQ